MVAVPTPCTERLRLIPGVYSAVTPEGELRLLAELRSRSLGEAVPWKREVLGRLAEEAGAAPEPVEAEPTEAEPTEADPVEAVSARNRAFVDLLWEEGWLLKTVSWQGRPVYTVRPSHGPAKPQNPASVPEPGQEMVLSRFTVIRRDGDRMVLEHPLAWGWLDVHDAGVVAVIGQLGRPTARSAVSGPLPAEVVTRVLDDLHRTGLAVSAPAAEEADLGRRQWAPHELWFHRRSRITHPGSTVTPYGRTLWAKERFEPLPARRDPYPGPAIDLHEPDLGELRRTDPTLAAVMEDRRSGRAYDDADPITVDELGELLYRCARIRRSFQADGIEYLSAPYPSGGSVYELEFYPVVRLAAGIDPGMYHYDAHRHRLGQVREMGPEVARLLASARAGTLERNTAQVLIVVAARFGRLMWAYQEMPYSLILKHVGVFYQTMYLAATAMGVAACAIGGGDGMAFTEATGVDYTVESSVGEFMLGRSLAD